MSSLNKVRKNARIRNRYNQIPHLTKNTIWKSDKNYIQNVTYKKAERSALSQQVTTRLQGTDKAVSEYAQEIPQSHSLRYEMTSCSRLASLKASDNYITAIENVCIIQLVHNCTGFMFIHFLELYNLNKPNVKGHTVYELALDHLNTLS